MTEDHPEQPEAEETPTAPQPPQDAEQVSTGHPAVDEVLRSMERLDGRPVDEHVGIFEEAHDVLRRTLAEGDAGSETGQE